MPDDERVGPVLAAEVVAEAMSVADGRVADASGYMAWAGGLLAALSDRAGGAFYVDEDLVLHRVAHKVPGDDKWSSVLVRPVSSEAP